jgi:acyl-coenzyme A thioesterase PaaI-like protein
MPNLIKLFAQFSKRPLGRRLFSRAVTLRAPYFGSIAPLVTELSDGRCEVALKKRRAVTNHIGTVHAIAMCNLCEMAAGLMIEASLPKALRWIPKGMTVRYLKKAETDLSGLAEWAAPPANDFRGDLVILVRVRDSQGTVVMEADITMYVSPKAATKG